MSQEAFKLMITKPCTKNWDVMLQTSDGRHCNSCKKNVIDFSTMKDYEVKNYFLQHKDEEICGRFYSNQLDRIKIHLPNNILQSDIAQWKKYIIILMICFGANLFSVEVVLGQTIDSLPTMDSIRPIDSLEIEDSLKAIDTSLMNDTMQEKDTLSLKIDTEWCTIVTGNTIQTVEHVYGGIGMFPIKAPIKITEWSTMGMIGTSPQAPKTLAEILNEGTVINEIKITTLSNSSSNTTDKNPPKKQELPQQQEFIIPDEIKTKRRK